MATVPIAAPSRHLLSVEAFHQMGETGVLGPAARVELIDGEIFEKSPIGVLHAAIVDALLRHLSRSVAESAVIRCQNPLRLDEFSEPEPDIAILRPRADCYTTAHPGPADVLLVIEVADSSLAYDLGTKVPLYARHGIPEVWVIDAATRVTHRFRGPGPAGYAEQATVSPETPLECAALPGDPRSLAAVLPLPPAKR